MTDENEEEMVREEGTLTEEIQSDDVSTEEGSEKQQYVPPPEDTTTEVAGPAPEEETTQEVAPEMVNLSFDVAYLTDTQKDKLTEMLDRACKYHDVITKATFPTPEA